MQKLGLSKCFILHHFRSTQLTPILYSDFRGVPKIATATINFVLAVSLSVSLCVCVYVCLCVYVCVCVQPHRTNQLSLEGFL